jgi:hypothetical protein
MRTVLALAAGVLAWTALAAEDKAPAFRFTKKDVGKLPAGWKAAKTGKGAGSVWKVQADDTAPSKTGFVLVQTAKGKSLVFNLCVADEGRYQDVEVKVAFKPLRGSIDQGGGIVWRYQDNNNYYVARMNPLEDNFRLYKVVAGARKELARKEELEVKAGTWHTLTIKQVGNQIECSLDGKKYLSARDDTIKKAGQVGLWTKADAQTAFDLFKVRDLKK